MPDRRSEENGVQNGHAAQTRNFIVGLGVTVFFGLVGFVTSAAKDSYIELERRVRAIEQTEMRDKQSSEYIRALEREVAGYRSEVLARRAMTDAKFMAIDERLKRLEKR